MNYTKKNMIVTKTNKKKRMKNAQPAKVEQRELSGRTIRVHNPRSPIHSLSLSNTHTLTVTLR